MGAEDRRETNRSLQSRSLVRRGVLQLDGLAERLLQQAPPRFRSAGSSRTFGRLDLGGDVQILSDHSALVGNLGICLCDRGLSDDHSWGCAQSRSPLRILGCIPTLRERMGDCRIRSEASRLILMPWDTFGRSLGMRHLLEMLSPPCRMFLRYYAAAWAFGSRAGVALREYTISEIVLYWMGVDGVRGVGRGLGCGWVGLGWIRHRALALPSAQ